MKVILTATFKDGFTSLDFLKKIIGIKNMKLEKYRRKTKLV